MIKCIFEVFRGFEFDVAILNDRNNLAQIKLFWEKKLAPKFWKNLYDAATNENYDDIIETLKEMNLFL